MTRRESERNHTSQYTSDRERRIAGLRNIAGRLRRCAAEIPGVTDADAALGMADLVEQVSWQLCTLARAAE